MKMMEETSDEAPSASDDGANGVGNGVDAGDNSGVAIVEATSPSTEGASTSADQDAQEPTGDGVPSISMAPFLLDAANTLRLCSASAGPFFDAELRLSRGAFQKASLMEALDKNDKERVLHFIRNKVGENHC